MSKLGWLTRIGGYAAAPFTGGWSIPAANVGAGIIEKRQAANDGPDGPNTLGKTPGTSGTAGDTSITGILQNRATDMSATGQGLLSQSQDTIGPILNYLKQIYGPNPAGVLEATRGERGRVIDQFDTARKAIAEFGPRGGGQTSALAASRLQEGPMLAEITSDAKSEARQLAATLGTQLATIGISAEQLASMDLDAVLRAVLAREGFGIEKRGQNMEALSGIGEALGKILSEKYFNKDK